MDRPIIDHYGALDGEVFGRLTVGALSHSDKNRNKCWNCRCECGKIVLVTASNLKNGFTKSCGCLARDKLLKRNTTHGMTGTGSHNIWLTMRQRCTNAKDAGYSNYGGRGIKICERWLDSFESFNTDLGKRPTPNHQIDRIDNDGNYEPSNCRWATSKENNLNRRNSRWWFVDGVKYESAVEAGNVVGITSSNIRYRCNKSPCYPEYYSAPKYVYGGSDDK